MDKGRKHHVESWVEENIYSFFDRLSKEGRYPTPQEVSAIGPLLQLYQSIQVAELTSELQSIWNLLVDGEASITVSTNYKGLDVNIREKPKSKEAS